MRLKLRAIGVALCATLGGNVFAGTVYDSGGFESPRFSQGPLAGQDGGAWVESGTGATAEIQSATFAGGNQAVQITRSTGDVRYFPQPASTPSVQRFVTVDWDMNVQRTQLDNVLFGPFFGIEAYTATTQLLTGAGIDATTGDVVPEAATTGVAAETGTKVAFDQFNHFQIVIDNKAKNVSLFVNGALAKKTGGFVDPSAEGFSDADLSALAAAVEPPTQPGVAYFDNYSVRTSDAGPGGSSVALPAALWPGLAMLTVAIVFRNRVRRPFMA